MNRIFTIFSFILLIMNSGYGQTYVSGGMLSNTSWTLGGSPYIVTGNIIVIASVTLTIEPGVEVKFDNGTNMEIRGFLIAQGTITDSIVFTTSAASPVSGSWNGINHWNDVTFDYVKFLYASDCLQYTGGPNISINHSYFAFNTVGISAFGYNGSIDNTLFENNGVGINSVGEADHITNCIFQNNFIGIGYIYSTLLSNCSFFGNSTKGADVINADVVNNLFQNNNVGLRIKVFNQGSLTIGNTIINNQIGVQIRGDISYTPNTNVYNNTICNNLINNMEISGNVSCYVENNCWCTTDSIAIGNSIYDAYDNLALGVIFFWPFHTNCTTGISEVNSIGKLTIFPNPIIKSENINTTIELVNSNIEIYNAFGSIVSRIENFSGSSINCDALKNGLYLLKVEKNNKQIEFAKFIVVSN